MSNVEMTEDAAKELALQLRRLEVLGECRIALEQEIEMLEISAKFAGWLEVDTRAELQWALRALGLLQEQADSKRLETERRAAP